MNNNDLYLSRFEQAESIVNKLVSNLSNQYKDVTLEAEFFHSPDSLVYYFGKDWKDSVTFDHTRLAINVVSINGKLGNFKKVEPYWEYCVDGVSYSSKLKYLDHGRINVNIDLTKEVELDIPQLEQRICLWLDKLLQSIAVLDSQLLKSKKKFASNQDNLVSFEDFYEEAFSLMLKDNYRGCDVDVNTQGERGKTLVDVGDTYYAFDESESREVARRVFDKFSSIRSKSEVLKGMADAIYDVGYPVAGGYSIFEAMNRIDDKESLSEKYNRK